MCALFFRWNPLYSPTITFGSSIILLSNKVPKSIVKNGLTFFCAQKVNIIKYVFIYEVNLECHIIKVMGFD